MMFIMSLVQKSQMAKFEREDVWRAVTKERWRREIILDSPCLNQSQIFDVIFRAGHDLDLSMPMTLTPWIRDDDLAFGIELYTVLHSCPIHLVESAQMFVFFEHLITHHSLKTLVAATMNNIKPRADEKIQDFSSIDLWYQKLDEVYNFALGPVLAAFSTTKQLRTMRTLKPPFLMSVDNKDEDGQNCKGDSCLSGKDPSSTKLQTCQVVIFL